MNTKVKLLTATMGTGALLTMGGVTVATSAAEEPAPVPPGPVLTSEVTTGETSTEGTAPPEPETTVAVPPVTATPPDGFGPPE
ncbi:MAG: hypothetical protein K0R01_1741 [Mycobacterium sp.]|nr:hypothetical protein [Mycobacterium sp.]